MGRFIQVKVMTDTVSEGPGFETKEDCKWA